MCNAKHDQNDSLTESKVQGWGTSTKGDETTKGQNKNAQVKAQSGNTN